LAHQAAGQGLQASSRDCTDDVIKDAAIGIAGVSGRAQTETE